MGQMNDIHQMARDTVEAIKRMSASLPDDTRALIFAEIVKQLAPAKARKPRPTLNALGMPLSEKYDPNYKSKKVSTAHLYKPYGEKLREHLTK